MPEEIKLPIAEIFTSIHGEGRWAGTRMTFIRLAGCTVGKFMGPNVSPFKNDFPMLPTGNRAYECTTFDGRKFPCDTDFNTSEKLTVREVVSRVPDDVSHVCVTGGEPLMHRGLPGGLFAALRRQEKTIHIETSGTIPVTDWFSDMGFYLACSPKAGYLPDVINRAGEVRLMVDKDFDIAKAREILDCITIPGRTQVYLAPLSSPNDVGGFDPLSLEKCLSLMEHPWFRNARISLQLHKILGVR